VPCSLVNRYQHFGRTCPLSLQGIRPTLVPPKHCYLSIKLHRITFQTTAIFIFTLMRALYLTNHQCVDYSLVGCDNMLFGREIPIFQMNLQPPPSMSILKIKAAGCSKHQYLSMKLYNNTSQTTVILRATVKRTLNLISVSSSYKPTVYLQVPNLETSYLVSVSYKHFYYYMPPIWEISELVCDKDQANANAKSIHCCQ
jgi:hypothetical protein